MEFPGKDTTRDCATSTGPALANTWKRVQRKQPERNSTNSTMDGGFVGGMKVKGPNHDGQGANKSHIEIDGDVREGNGSVNPKLPPQRLAPRQ